MEIMLTIVGDICTSNIETACAKFVPYFYKPLRRRINFHALLRKESYFLSPTRSSIILVLSTLPTAIMSLNSEVIRLLRERVLYLSGQQHRPSLCRETVTGLGCCWNVYYSSALNITDHLYVVKL